MRLFVAVQPPDDVLDALEGLDRPERPGVRWSRRDQWHVTLFFLGEVTEAEPVADALREAPLRRCEAAIGPRVTSLGRQVLCLPVLGLDDLAHDVAVALRAWDTPAGGRGFRGHLTLARVRRGSATGLAGEAFERRFPVTEVRLIRSHLDPDRARYEDLLVRPLL